MELRIVKGQQLVASDLAEQIIEFDRKNMQPILEMAGIEFPEEKRRKGLQSDPTFIIALDGQAIVGYLEYLRSWNDPNYIYVGSVQIGERYRNTHLLLELLDEFRSLVSKETFLGFETNVQKVNSLAVKMYQKIGFRLEQNPNNEASWLARADREILKESPIIPLLDKWRERKGGTAQPKSGKEAVLPPLPPLSWTLSISDL